MKRGILIIGTLLAGTPVLAADPRLAAAAPATKATDGESRGLPKRLDLRVGDIRKYMTPEEFRALSAPPDEANTVIVQANVPLLPMKSELDVPGGLIAPFWALVNPHKAWRLFLPDPRVNINEIPPPETKVPPRVFRWGP